jgi:hypothetical protein
MTNAEFQKTIAMICGLDYATPTKEQSAAIEEMEKIIQEWKKEFERTSGIQAVVTNNNSGQYKVIYEDCSIRFIGEDAQDFDDYTVAWVGTKLMGWNPFNWVVIVLVALLAYWIMDAVGS